MSNTNEEVARQAKQREVLTKAFKELDKNDDDSIDKNEISIFFKSKGKNINQETIEKLFKTLDFDQNGVISVDEFINAYLKNLKELEDYIKELKEGEDESKLNADLYEKEMNKYKSEKLNNEGLSSEAHLKVFVSKIELQNRNSPINNPKVIVKLDEYNQLLKSSGRQGGNFIYDREMEMYVFIKNLFLISKKS